MIIFNVFCFLFYSLLCIYFGLQSASVISSAGLVIGGILSLIPSEVLLTKPLILPMVLIKILTPTFLSSVPYSAVYLNQLIRLCVINTSHNKP